MLGFRVWASGHRVACIVHTAASASYIGILSPKSLFTWTPLDAFRDPVELQNPQIIHLALRVSDHPNLDVDQIRVNSLKAGPYRTVSKKV